MQQKLLPVGFYDLLFEEAEKNHENINKILSGFFAKGYRLIKTPLIEFEDNFSKQEIQNSFRLTDVISGRNLILRNDITPQISRLLATRLKQENLPIKICYVGDVFYAKSEELHADRQQTQIGFELIGCDKEESNFEAIKLTLYALEQVKAEDLLIEFSFPGFLKIFLAEIGVKDSAELREAVMKKNISAIREMCGAKADQVTDIALNNETCSSKLPQTQKISEFLKKNFSNVKVRFDLFGDHGSPYHYELAFDVFSKNFSYPIARGGCYKINDLNSVGATIYMNRLRKFS